jgi:hypothetical protein
MINHIIPDFQEFPASNKIYLSKYILPKQIEQEKISQKPHLIIDYKKKYSMK